MYPPWGTSSPPLAPWTHTLLTKISHGQICTCCGHHYACCGRHCAWRGKIWPKISLPKGSFTIFWKFFLSFLGFSMVKIHFFQKVLKKWSSFRKKLLYFFPLLGGGVQTPKWKFPLFIFIFFEPFPKALNKKNVEWNLIFDGNNFFTLG